MPALSQVDALSTNLHWALYSYLKKHSWGLLFDVTIVVVGV